MRLKTTILNRWMLTLLLPVLLPWFGCVKTYSTATDQSLTPQQPAQSLLDYLKNNYSFSMFYAAIQRVGLDKQLQDSTKKYTILMPDDDAFALANITMDSLMNADTAYLRKWMGFHIIQGAVGYDSVPQTVDNIFYSILGQKIFLSKPVNLPQAGQQVMHANGTAVVSFDISAFNGYIQVLSTPLNAPLEGTLQDYINANLDQYSLFKAALQHFNLWDSLADTTKPLTVFAPVNSAFQNLLLLNISDNYNYDPYTITTDTIAGWNTNVIPTDVFGVYLFPGRIFTSDFSDAPRNALYIMPDQQATINFSSQNPPQITGALLNYAAENQLMQGEYGVSVAAPIMSPANFVTLNGNGVLQPVSALTMVP